jgi:hypothetical protein
MLQIKFYWWLFTKYVIAIETKKVSSIGQQYNQPQQDFLWPTRN